MKSFLIIFLAIIGAGHCQHRCGNRDDIAKILETSPTKQKLEYLLDATDKQAAILNQTLYRYKPDEYPDDPVPIQCSVAIIGNLFTDIDLHVDDDKWEVSESTLQQYESLEKSMNESSSRRMKRGLFGFFRRVVRGIVKIARVIAKVIQVVRTVVNFVRTAISIVRDVRGMFRNGK